MPVLVKAIYKRGVFEPIEPIEDLVESQQVHLQVWPAVPGEVPSEVEEGADFWSDPGWEAEWAALNPWEQQGLHVPVLTPEEIEARVQWLNINWGCIALDSLQAIEVATAEWMLEENLSL